MLRMLAIAIAAAATFAITACGSGSGGKSCEGLCSDAQAGDCTDIKGDCSKFCSAANNVKGPAMCGSQYDAYQSCLGEKSNVCDAICNSKESAFSQCMTAYCTNNATNSDCVVLAASF